MTAAPHRGPRRRHRFAGLILLVLAGCAASSALSVPQQAARELLLRAPLSVIRPSFFHAALLVPPMQQAATLPADAAVLTLSSNHAQSKSFRDFNGIRSWFSGAFHEWLAADLRWSAAPGLELSARSAISGWDEAQDHFSLFDAGGNYMVRNESQLQLGNATQRHENVARLDLGARLELLDSGTAQTAVSGMVKLPIARPGDLTNAGTIDLAATLLQSVALGDFSVHGNVGWVWPTGAQNLFEPDQGIRVNPFVQGGVALVWRATADLSLDVQVQANQSAFRDVPFLLQSPVTFVAGARRAFGRGFLEVSGGCGLNRASSDWWELFVGYGWVL